MPLCMDVASVEDGDTELLLYPPLKQGGGGIALGCILEAKFASWYLCPAAYEALPLSEMLPWVCGAQDRSRR